MIFHTSAGPATASWHAAAVALSESHRAGWTAMGGVPAQTASLYRLIRTTYDGNVS